MNGPYYRVISHGFYDNWYKVQIWRWWFPIWWTVRDNLDTEQQAKNSFTGIPHIMMEQNYE